MTGICRDSLYDFSSSRNVQQTAYYPTVFNISLYDGFGDDVPESRLKNLLTEIIKIYKDTLLHEYVYEYKKEAIIDIIDLSDLDYRYQLDILRERFRIINSYAKELYKKNIGFKYDNASFNDICVKCDSIAENDLAGLEALIMVNASSKSLSRLRNQYQYNINQLTDSLEQAQNNLDEIDGLINEYKMDDILYVGVGDSYVKVESNSSKTYEQLIDNKQSITNKITELNSELTKYRQYINDLSSGANSTNNDPQIKINKIIEKLSQIEEIFEHMIIAFNDSLITADDIIMSKISFVSPALISGSFIIRTLNIGFPIFLIAMILFSLYMVITEVRKMSKP